MIEIQKIKERVYRVKDHKTKGEIKLIIEDDKPSERLARLALRMLENA